MNEMPSVYICDTPKARKDHVCWECVGTIKAGEKYHKHHGIWQGEAATYKVCLDCDQLRSDMDDGAHPEESTAFGYLSENVMENDHDATFFFRYMAIKRKRGAVIKAWMIEREEQLWIEAGSSCAIMTA